MASKSGTGRSRRWRRIIVAIVFIASLVYLVIFVRGLLFEAQMSLGIIRPAEQGILARIVNKEEYTPPPDGVLRPSHIMSLHEIARQLDSLAKTDADKASIESQLVFMLNRYTMSAGEYRWVRTTATRYMTGRRIQIRSRGDSVNLERLRMLSVDLTSYARFYRDSLDRSLLT